ncbi:MAG: redox-regulated ATPase YchF [Candidatus Tagabacteria bacterium CG03_land_8_20_14_0_80_41_22]|uniref:Redox-regulated ATPase YchF n=1 Tax=Candidatus Tagabacteria bacterium CG03_land_8_20_14_0_80_41_22 TaxID=1975020 RepID=A0A2M7B8Y3_9BACT|nr:MAG: redox-regulated ATPase YchF [Candidatus Tagabacteria bacterium CG03_land_8_20_14_0_80_41_22]
MKIGIVGLPNVGKSTLFKALTKKQVDISNYPFCTIEPNVGIVPVPDERLQMLTQFSNSKKTVPAVIEFFDIAGLVKGAAEGEGLGNKFLSHIREVDVIAEVVRVFENEKIIHVHKKIDPENDISVIETELILADSETTDKRIGGLAKDMKSRNKEAEKRMTIVRKVKQTLDSGKAARESSLSPDEFAFVKDLHLLTFKPVLYVYNVSGSDKISDGLAKKNHVIADIKIEEELMEMEEKDKRELGFSSNLGDLIKKAYEMLGLITFLTTGEDETRAWAIKKGSNAPEAGAAIHTDFQEKFIRASVIHYNKLIEAGSMQKAREHGWLRTEGKDYIVSDGDVIEFKI